MRENILRTKLNETTEEQSHEAKVNDTIERGVKNFSKSHVSEEDAAHYIEQLEGWARGERKSGNQKVLFLLREWSPEELQRYADRLKEIKNLEKSAQK